MKRLVITKLWTDYDVDSSGLPLRVTTAGSQEKEPVTRKPRGFEPGFLIHLTLAGEGKLLKDGLLYTLSPGSVLFSRPGHPLFYSPSVSPWGAIWITFRGELAERLLTLESGIYRAKDDFLLKMLEKIRDLSPSERSERASALLYRLLLSFESRIQPQRLLHSGRENEGVYKARNFIHLHYANKITVEDLAAEAGMLRRTFERKWKNAFNESPLDYLNKYRIAESFEFLKYFPDMPIAEVAERVGFSSATHYNYICRRYKEKRPSEARAEYIAGYSVGEFEEAKK